MKKFQFMLLLVVHGLLVSACADTMPEVGRSESPSPAENTGESSPTLIPTPIISTNMPDNLRNVPIVTELIGRAIADLSERLNVSEDQIRVIDIEKATWSDAGLGCPKPEVTYIQKPTEGYIIQLEANGQHYEYRVDTNQNVILCQPDSEENNSLKNSGSNIQDGGPNQTKDRDVIIITPTR